MEEKHAVWSRFKTISTVLVLSILIWVFADRAVLQSKDISFDLLFNNTPPNIVLEFDGSGTREEMQIQTVKLSIKGASSIISRLGDDYEEKRKLEVGELGIDFTMFKEGEFRDISKEIMGLLNNRIYKKADNNNYLQVTAAMPQETQIRVTKLTLKEIPVEVYNNKTQLSTVNPLTVKAYTDNTGNPSYAKIILSDKEVEMARLGPYKAIATAVIGFPGKKNQTFDIEIKLPAQTETPGIERAVKSKPLIFILMPEANANKFKVKIVDDSLSEEARGAINFKGPEDLNQRYIDLAYHLILYIGKDDLAIAKRNIDTGILNDPVNLEYHLPAEFADIIFDPDPPKKRPVNVQIVEVVNNTTTGTSTAATGVTIE